MRHPTALLLLLCACVARPTIGDPDDPTGDDPTGDDPTGGETTSADESTSDPTTTPVTTVGTATATFTTGDVPLLGFEVDIQPIFDEHCVAACHEPTGEWGFLLDLSGSAYAAIVGVASPQLPVLSHVEPGDPQSSYLWRKLSNTQAAAGGSGLPMPKARAGMSATTLTQEQLDTIEEWILQGAPP